MFVGKDQIDRQFLFVGDLLAELLQSHVDLEVVVVEQFAVIDPFFAARARRSRGGFAGRPAAAAAARLFLVLDAEQPKRRLALADEMPFDRIDTVRAEKAVQFVGRGIQVLGGNAKELVSHQ